MCSSRARPAGTVPSPYSRWLSGGCHSAVTCPSPRQGSADQLITGDQARAPERPRPPVWRAHAGPRPAVGSAYLREEAWPHFRSQNPCRLLLGEGGALCNQLGRGRCSPARRIPPPKRKEKSFPAKETAVLPGCGPAHRSAKMSGSWLALQEPILES